VRQTESRTTETIVYYCDLCTEEMEWNGTCRICRAEVCRKCSESHFVPVSGDAWKLCEKCFEQVHTILRDWHLARDFATTKANKAFMQVVREYSTKPAAAPQDGEPKDA
jgi:hypothetical protein